MSSATTRALSRRAASPNGGDEVSSFRNRTRTGTEHDSDRAVTTGTVPLSVMTMPVRPRRRGRRAASVTAAHVAWMAFLPAALLMAGLFALASRFANSLFPSNKWTAFPSVRSAGFVRPEPVDQVRWLVSLATPLLILVLLWLVWRELSGRAARRRLDIVVFVIQLASFGFLAVCWALRGRSGQWFTEVDLMLALPIALLLLALARAHRLPMPKPSVRRAHWTTLAGVAVVLLVTGSWLLPAVFNESNVAGAQIGVRYHLQFTFDEFVAAANDRTAMVDFANLYSRLLPLAVEPVFEIFGSTLGTFTWIMWALSLVSLAAVYGVFLTVTERHVSAIVLYLPFLAMSLVGPEPVEGERVYLANLYGVLPLRLVGPFLVALLSARYVRRPFRGGSLLGFFLAGLSVVNNPEFGLPCFVAFWVALWCSSDRLLSGRQRALMLLGRAVTGGWAAAAVTLVLTVVRTSSLPKWEYFTHFPRVFTVEGLTMTPMPLLGLHVIVFLTFVAAVVGAVAAHLTSSSSTKPVMVGLLAYSGVLGLGSLSYWAGRSEPSQLLGIFPIWGLTVALMAWWVLTVVARRRPPSARPMCIWALPSVTVLTAFGLMFPAVLEFPSPLEQVERIGAVRPGGTPDVSVSVLDAPSSFDLSAEVSFVRRNTTPGERVAILASVGHEIAERSGVVNVSPYSHQNLIGFNQQMEFVLRAIDAAGAHKVFVGPTWPEISGYLEKTGHVVTAHDSKSGISLWVPNGAPLAVLGGAVPPTGPPPLTPLPQ